VIYARVMRRLIVLLLFPLVAFAYQSPKIEYGSESELKGVRSIYVYTATELDDHNRIVKEIQKRIKGIVITDKPETADVCLIYGSDFATFYAGTYSTGTVTNSTIQANSTPRYQSIVYGTGMVVKVKPDGTARLLLDFKDSQSTRLERRPTTNFARAFAKAYEKANKD
jgi:hypothetical protein